MLETGSLLKQKSLEQLKNHQKHYQKQYFKAKLEGQVVLRQYLKKLNQYIQQKSNLLTTN